MKKILAILLTALMLFGTCASAETVRFVENSTAFDIVMELPEDAVVMMQMQISELSIVTVGCKDLANVSISIAPSDIYDDKNLADLTDDEVMELMSIAGSQFENPAGTVDVTPSGNKYIHICSNDSSDMDVIFTVYKGYFVELTQWREDFEPLTEEDEKFMFQLLYNIEFIPVEA